MSNITTTQTKVGGFNFGGASKISAPKKVVSKYPVLDPSTPVVDQSGRVVLNEDRKPLTIQKLAAQISIDNTIAKSVEGSLKVNKSLLIETCRPFWFQKNAGSANPASSLEIQTDEGVVRVQFQDKYSLPRSREDVASIIGEEATDAYFQPSFKLSIDGSKLPNDDRTQTLLDIIHSTLEELGPEFAPVEGGAITFVQSVIPRKGFAKVRHTAIPIEKNIALEAVCPTQGQVKTVGNGDNE
jgi:hypothetical protein